MALYKRHGTNPFSACLPLIIQMPFFFALFNVLNNTSKASGGGQGIGALTPQDIRQFDQQILAQVGAVNDAIRLDD